MTTLSMQDYANLGSAVMTGNPAYVSGLHGQALHARNSSRGLRMLSAYALPPSRENLNTTIDGPTVAGIETATYEKMKQIQGAALALDIDIKANVKRQAFKDAWEKWFKGWTEFFDKYSGFLALGFKNSLFDSDAVALQAEAYRRELMGDLPAKIGWVGGYAAEGTPGSPLPRTTAPDVAPLVFDPAVKPSEGLPWWVISLLVTGGISIVAGIYYVVKSRAIEKEFHREMLPMVMGSFMGAPGIALANAAQSPHAHDPSGMGVPPFSGQPGQARVFVVG